MRTREEIINKINDKELDIKLINESHFIPNEELSIEVEILICEIKLLEWVLEERDL